MKEEWLKKWFINHGANEELCEEITSNYFELGLIDSYAIIELISSIENEFGVHLNQDHFNDPRFSTIKGLGEIIQELSH